MPATQSKHPQAGIPKSLRHRRKIAKSKRAYHERVRTALALLDGVEAGSVEIREVSEPTPDPSFVSNALTFGQPASEAR
jgi:hypothetical protein